MRTLTPLSTHIGLFVVAALFFPALSQAERIQLDLISPATCKLRSTILTNCQLGPDLIEVVDYKNSWVPLKTRIEVRPTGNCSTQFPVAIRIQSETHRTSARLLAVAPNSTVLRALDRTAIGKLSIEDDSPWTKSAQFDQSCRSTLEVYLNEVDYPDADTALEDFREHANDLLIEHRQLSRLETLKRYRGLFQFFYELSKNLLIKLKTHPTEILRAHSQSALILLQDMKRAQDDKLSFYEKSTLNRIENLIEDLQLREDWETRTLSSYLNSADLEWIQSHALTADQEPTLESDLLTYSKRFQESCSTLFQAKNQLSELIAESQWKEFHHVFEICQH